jgi:hypothetical protein
MSATIPFKRLILRAVLRDVSPMVARLISVSDETELSDLQPGRSWRGASRTSCGEPRDYPTDSCVISTKARQRDSIPISEGVSRMSNKSDTNPQTRDIQTEFQTLHDICAATLRLSFEGERSSTMAKSFLFAEDLSGWRRIIAPNPESALYGRAEQEYLAALINVAQGQYCNAFKGLRLVVELTLQGAYLSVNILELHEWLRNSIDTRWATLMDPSKGPLSHRFCEAFFPALRDSVDSFATIAQTLYRELSEVIHGNIPNKIPLPASYHFDQETFDLWHEKAETARMTCIFCLSVRYLDSLSETNRAIVEHGVMDQLGHIESVRTLLGGPATA